MRAAIALSALLLAACGGERAPQPAPSVDLYETLPAELLAEANRGRAVLDADGRFALPPETDRVWIDVGAHELETTLRPLTRLDGLTVIAIEPLEEAWRKWPDRPNLIALPVALADVRGWLEFNVTASSASSSLLESARDSEIHRIVDKRRVPVLRLQDVLERVPGDVEIEYVKTDVQGLDLEVLRSAGEQLRRVTFIRTEIIKHDAYVADGGRGPAPETEYLEFLGAMGFRHLSDINVEPEGRWLDKTFVNERDTALDRLRRWLRQLPSVTKTDPF